MRPVKIIRKGNLKMLKKAYIKIVLILSIIAIAIDAFKIIKGTFSSFDAILMTCSILGIIGACVYSYTSKFDNG